MSIKGLWRILIPPFGGSVPAAPAKHPAICGKILSTAERTRQQRASVIFKKGPSSHFRNFRPKIPESLRQQLSSFLEAWSGDRHKATACEGWQVDTHSAEPEKT